MIAYVKAELAAGKSPAAVGQALLAAGWPPADVEQALLVNGGNTAPLPVPPPPPPAGMAGGWSIGRGNAGYGARYRTVRQMTPGQMVAMGAAFFVIGGLIAFFGARSYLNTQSLLKNGQRLEGAVIRLDEKIETDTNGTSRTYRPVVQYKLADGTVREYASNLWRSSSPFGVGQKVNMIYDPKSGQAMIDTPGEIFVSSYMMLGVGGIFALAGLAVILTSRRRIGIVSTTTTLAPPLS